MQRPRIESFPAVGESVGREAIELAESGGVVLDPWQQIPVLNGMGVRADGRWAAFEVGVNAARQNGKNEVALVRELAGLFLLGERLIIHSAHEWKTSMEHQRRIEQVVQDTPDLHKRVKPRGYKHAHGEESIELRTGQRIRFMTRTKGGGKGHTGDTVLLDEAQILAAAMLGALMPTLSARSVTGNPQLWYFGTAVDQMVHGDGLSFARVRARALTGEDPSLAYFEWSADADDPEAVTVEMATDPARWLMANPAMGIRISEEHIANEQRSMDPRTFAVERLGVGDWPSLDASGAVIDQVNWAACGDETSRMVDPVVLGFDVTPDRSFASIGAAGFRPDGVSHVEVVERRRGTAWVMPRLRELDETHRPKLIVCDSLGPGASLLLEGEAQTLRVTRTSTREFAEGCALFFDHVERQTLRHLAQPDLDSAVASATQRRLGDAWLWSRRDAKDISPLAACTLALWGLLHQPSSVYEERGLLVLGR